MKAVVVTKPGHHEIQERPIPKPGRGEVLIKVLACGVCHSDLGVLNAYYPGLALPRVPGHEVVGIVEALGEDVKRWKVGERVGAGWFGGNCFECRRCDRGDFITCQKGKVTGISHDGGYAEYQVQPQEALARVPDGLSNEEAAPLLCAGITVFNALRHTGALAGDVVAIQGLGGLGHLAVQFAVKMGYKTVVLGRGKEKKKHAEELGAHLYIDAKDENDPGFAKIKEWGGANVILSTAPASAMTGLIDILAVGGTLLVVAVDMDQIPGVTPLALLMKRAKVAGWPSGSASDWEDTMNFAVLTGIKPTVTKYSLKDVGQAIKDMESGKVGRAVLVPGL
eukprot:TRINITY_DN2964_c0_g1_i1.p1 TRINITY_DN2964_c0_g1~~TRINITY_DN2964_c0_g1_i1.p1  ORF type:complete len:337 (+),score=70.07 TRINITY_DN2964_c0_g1_i1:573-1583(+)